MKRWNVFDLFLVLFLVVAGLAVYFTFVKPLQFSNLIHREGVNRVAEVEIFLYDDMPWMKDFLKVGDERRDVYGEVEWKILDISEMSLAGRSWVKVKVRVVVVEETSGILRYGKYNLTLGNSLHFITDKYVFGGRIYSFRLLQEGVPE